MQVGLCLGYNAPNQHFSPLVENKIRDFVNCLRILFFFFLLSMKLNGVQCRLERYVSSTIIS